MFLGLANQATSGDILVPKGVDWLEAYERPWPEKYGPKAQVAAE
jgi:hypothetical protein